MKTSLRKLDMLAAAVTLDDLRVPPGNRLEALKGGLRGEHSIRVNDQWRIVFRWTPQGPVQVRLIAWCPKTAAASVCIDLAEFTITRRPDSSA